MAVSPSKEIKMKPEDMLVSKTDNKDRYTYCNDAFMTFSGFSEEEILGQHNDLIRHADTPEAIFRLMWNKLQQGDEFFGVNKNLCKNGHYYWSYVNVFVNYDANNQLIGYMSTRRCPPPEAIDFFNELYPQMIEIESQYNDSSEGIDASYNFMNEAISKGGMGYDEYVCSYFK